MKRCFENLTYNLKTSDYKGLKRKFKKVDSEFENEV